MRQPGGLALPIDAERRCADNLAMRISTWNVNSVRQRLDHLTGFLKDVAPDVLCLQELKCMDEAFPRAEVEALGYHAAVHGQKGFNGVAILSKAPLAEAAAAGLPGAEDDAQSRYIEGVVGADEAAVRVACLYLPNGNPVGTEKFDYKLAWMDRLHKRAEALLDAEDTFVLAGDFNVIPEARDAKNPAAWVGDALYRPETKAKFRELLALGLTDALRAGSDRADLFTFWDYQALSWQRNNGIRIDHLLLSPRAADRLAGVDIHKDMRGLDKPSDHVPVSVVLREA